MSLLTLSFRLFSSKFKSFQFFPYSSTKMIVLTDEIKELNKPHIYIKDKENVNRIISEIVKGGPEKLQIISDFDRTITKQHNAGKPHISSFGMFSKCKSIPPAYKESEKSLTAKYLPIEVDPKIPYEEKRKAMEEWWSQSEKALKGLTVPLSEIDDVVKVLGPALRDGTPELFKSLHEINVPVLVFSAGLGDSVVSVLKYFNVLLPNVKVVSNFLKFEDGVIQGFEFEAIHVLNKNEFALKGTKYYDLVKNRGNVILMGDMIGDAGMADGVPHCNVVLKIGFLYDHIEESLPKYMDAFDIVLVDDQSMDVVRGILKYL